MSIPTLTFIGDISFITFNKNLEIPLPTVDGSFNPVLNFFITDISNNSTDASGEIISDRIFLTFVNTNIYLLNFFAINDISNQSLPLQLYIDVHPAIIQKITTIDTNEDLELSVARLIDGSSVVFQLDSNPIFPPISDVSNMKFIVYSPIPASFMLEIFTPGGVLSIQEFSDISGIDDFQLLNFNIEPEPFRLLNQKIYTIRLTCLTPALCLQEWFCTRYLFSSLIIKPITNHPTFTNLYPCFEFTLSVFFDIDLGLEPRFFYNNTLLTSLSPIIKFVKPHIRKVKIINDITIIPDQALDFSNNELFILTNLDTNKGYEQGLNIIYFRAEDRYGRVSELTMDIEIIQDLDSNLLNDLSFNYLDLSGNIISRNKGGDRMDLYIQSRKTRLYKDGKASLRPINNNDVARVLELNRNSFTNAILLNLRTNKANKVYK